MAESIYNYQVSLMMKMTFGHPFYDNYEANRNGVV